MRSWIGSAPTGRPGPPLWPLNSFAERRAANAGGLAAGVADEVEVVLTAMRRRPAWYEKYFARPFGRKQAPVFAAASRAEPMPAVVDAVKELAGKDADMYLEPEEIVAVGASCAF